MFFQIQPRSRLHRTEKWCRGGLRLGIEALNGAPSKQWVKYKDATTQADVPVHRRHLLRLQCQGRLKSPFDDNLIWEGWNLPEAMRLGPRLAQKGPLLTLARPRREFLGGRTGVQGVELDFMCKPEGLLRKVVPSQYCLVRREQSVTVLSHASRGCDGALGKYSFHHRHTRT